MMTVDGVDQNTLAQLRDVAERGHAPEEVLTALRIALRYYDLAHAAWQGCREEFTEKMARLDVLEQRLDSIERRGSEG